MSSKYKLDEIDSMRIAVRGLARYNHLERKEVSEETIEKRLQTYISNGVTAKELKDKLERLMDAEFNHAYTAAKLNASIAAKTTPSDA